MGREAIKADRNTVIFQMRKMGEKYSAIARQFQITRQRAHQIVEAVGQKLSLAEMWRRT